MLGRWLRDVMPVTTLVRLKARPPDRQSKLLPIE